MPERSLGRPDMRAGSSYRMKLDVIRRALKSAEAALGDAVNDLRNGYVYNGVDNNLAGDVLDQTRQLVARTRERLIEG